MSPAGRSPPDPVKGAVDDWKFADRAAFEAEMKLADAKRLRTVADKRQSTALQLMRTGAAP